MTVIINKDAYAHFIHQQIDRLESEAQTLVNAFNAYATQQFTPLSTDSRRKAVLHVLQVDSGPILRMFHKAQQIVDQYDQWILLLQGTEQPHHRA
jgi:hypothetical protein